MSDVFVKSEIENELTYTSEEPVVSAPLAPPVYDSRPIRLWKVISEPKDRKKNGKSASLYVQARSEEDAKRIAQPMMRICFRRKVAHVIEWSWQIYADEFNGLRPRL